MNATQICPSCHNSKTSNPDLKLMVNVCGHLLCETCVETLYVRGSGLCVTCNNPIRKVNFRYQLFENPLVQKEIEMRKKLLYDFNKRQSDFDSIEEYDAYLEKFEELVYNLVNDVDVDETKKYIEAYKRDNKDIIKRNRTKPHESMEFFDREIEREREIREMMEKEDEEELEQWKQSRLEKRENKLKGLLGDFVTTQPAPSADSVAKKKAASSAMPPPSSAMPIDPSKKFIPPPSASAAGSKGRGFDAPPSMATPVSLMMPQSAFLCPASATQWAQNPEKHHKVSITNTFKQTQHVGGGGGAEQLKRAKTDQLRMDSGKRPREAAKTNMPAPYDHQIPKPLLFGPDPPAEESPLWPHIRTTFDQAIIDPLTADISRAPVPEDFQPGISDRLPIGACGISPYVFLHRSLQESCCGLFLRNE